MIIPSTVNRARCRAKESPFKQGSLSYDRSPSNAFAALRSTVAKPSVNGKRAAEVRRFENIDRPDHRGVLKKLGDIADLTVREGSLGMA
jgi:hypothetical protein